MRFTRLIPVLVALALGASTQVRAQIALSSAVDLALKNSPKVRMAQADLDKARAALSEAKDAYVPNVSTTGGVGKSTGAPLGVPVVFSISAQSLVFTFSQMDYIRSAHAGVDSAQHTLNEARIEVAADVTNTYVTLDNALQRRAVLREEQGMAGRLVDITNDRVTAGVDAHIELTKSKRTAAQMKLQMLYLEDEIAGQTQHLAQLTGLSNGGLTTDRASIPVFARPVATTTPPATSTAQSEGVAAAYAIARARQFSAFGDRRYLLRPQVAFGANYSRVNTAFSSYSDYYPRFSANANSENSLSLGLQITIPLLDMVHHAKARESAADAVHALAEANMQRDLFLDGRAKLRNAARELDARTELASLDRDIAQDQIDALELQLQAGAANLSGPQVTPKDELNARLQERQKYYDYLSATLQLQQTQVNLLRQDGALADWIHQSIALPGQAPAPAIVTPQTNTPAVPGNAPVAPAPSPTGAPAQPPTATPPQP